METTAVQPGRGRGRIWKVAGVLLVAGLLAWLLLAQWQTARRVTYVIPAGTATGRVTVDFPDEITFTLGVKDTLVIENQDDVVHTFGPFVIAPNSTLTKRFSHPLVYEGTCTVHQGKQMKLVVEPAPWQIRQ